jgi:hypothetical protein
MGNTKESRSMIDLSAIWISRAFALMEFVPDHLTFEELRKTREAHLERIAALNRCIVAMDQAIEHRMIPISSVADGGANRLSVAAQIADQFRDALQAAKKAALSIGGATAAQDLREASCVEKWPECESGLYDPRCCRFPKSCSCDSAAISAAFQAATDADPS